MLDCYDKDGTPITETLAWAKKLEDREYAIVSRTIISKRKWLLWKYEILVSTVWLGLNHNFHDPSGPPIIFETMVFVQDPKPILGILPKLSKKFDEFRDYQERYSTQEEARKDHRELIIKVSKSL